MISCSLGRSGSLTMWEKKGFPVCCCCNCRGWLSWGALPPCPSFGLDHFKRQESKIPPLTASTPKAPIFLEEVWGAWGWGLPSQPAGGEAQSNLLGPHLVNSALVLTYFLGEKIEYRFKCSGVVENYRPSRVRK